MNSDHQILDSEAGPNSPPQEPESSPPPPYLASRGNGFVARLPKAIREQLNQMMLDGIRYAEIIKRLGEPARHLEPNHLTEWKKRGHQDWLRHQDWLAERRARQESAADLLADMDPTEVNQGALHLGTLYIYDALRDLSAGSLDDKLGGDSAAFARLLNALSRASRETLQLQKYRDACAHARAALHQLKDPKRKLNESETRAIVLQVDEILGLRSRPDPDPVAANTTAATAPDATTIDPPPPPEHSITA